MSLEQALSVFDLRDFSFNEEYLKKIWRDFSKKYHPDVGINPDSEKFKIGNEAHEILLKYKSFNSNFVMKKILNLNARYITNLSDVNIPKLPIVKEIENEINALKNKYLGDYNYLKINDVDMFEKDYNSILTKIKQIIEKYVSDILAKMKEIYIEDAKISALYEHTKELILSQNDLNVYSIYSNYEKYIQAVSQYINNNQLSSEYVKKKHDILVEKYLANKAFYNNDSYKVILGKINNLLTDLVFKSKQYGDVIKFEKFYKQIDQKIEEYVIDYRNKLFDELKDSRLSNMFPKIDVIINSAKINMFDKLNISDIYEVYNETKKKIEITIKEKIKEELNLQVEPFTKDPNYSNVKGKIGDVERRKVEEYYKKISSHSFDYVTEYRNILYNIFHDYELLVNKKQELLGDLEPFITDLEAINMINELNNTVEYDRLEIVNNEASRLVERLSKKNKKESIANAKNKLLEKFQSQQQKLSISETREYLRVLDDALELLEKYEKHVIDIDLDSLNKISFVNKIEDLKCIKDASIKKKNNKIEDENLELMFDLVTRASRRN